MHPILIRFGDFTLHTYGVLLALGFLLAVFLAREEGRRAGIDPDVMLDLSFYLLVGALLGSRLFYVLTNWPEFAENPIDVVKFWRGGLVFYGGLIFAFLIGTWYVRKYRLNFQKLADVAAPSIALGQALGLEPAHVPFEEILPAKVVRFYPVVVYQEQGLLIR